MVRPAHAGDTRSLVLAFDIGTTFSGISYALLDPGQVPQINSVTRFVLPLVFTLRGDSSEKLTVSRLRAWRILKFHRLSGMIRVGKLVLLERRRPS